MPHLFVFHVKGSKALYPRRVYDVSSLVKGIHLREGRCMRSLVVNGGYFPRLQVLAGQNGIDERRFPHSRVAGQQRDFSGKHFFYFPNSGFVQCGDAETRIAYVCIEVGQAFQQPFLVVRVDVGLVEYQSYRHTVRFGRCQKAVDENGRCFRVVDRGDEHALVYVCRNDVQLFGKVGCPADDIVFPVFYFGDEGRTFRVQRDVHPVAHSYRVGAFESFQAEAAFDLAVHQLSAVSLDLIPAPCTSYYQSFLQVLQIVDCWPLAAGRSACSGLPSSRFSRVIRS